MLHVGAMKTGSSALQRAFTVHPIRPATAGAGEGTFEYVGLVPWELLRGRRLLEASTYNGDGYERSATLEAITQESPERRAVPLRHLRELRESGTVPILSMETWLHETKHVHGFAALLDGPLHVVAYVAPQVGWLNSRFWQRYSMAGRSLDRFLDTLAPRADWACQLEAWRSAPGVERVSVRLKCRDIVPDFCGLIGCESSGGGVSWNASLPGAFARYIDRWSLPDHFASSAFKQVFARWLSIHDPGGDMFRALGPTPVVIGPDEIRWIVARFEEGNRRLLEWCEPDVAERIRGDRRWWSADPADHAPKDHEFIPTPALPPGFVGRRVEPSAEDCRRLLLETDLLLEATLGALVKADEACRVAERERIAAAATTAASPAPAAPCVPASPPASEDARPATDPVLHRRSEGWLAPIRRVIPWPRRAGTDRADGVELTGFIRAEIGIGQAARLLATAIESAAIPLTLRDLPIPGRANEHGFDARLGSEVRRRVGVTVTGLDKAGVRRWPGRNGQFRIVYPFWELSEIPRAFRRALRAQDAAWAPSTIVAEALRSIGVEAPLIRQPVAIPPGPRLVPIRPAGEPLSVLTYLDFDSFPARKNVRAAVTAFRRAFPSGHPAALTVKVRGTAGAEDRAWLASQVAEDRRIRVVDATLPWGEVEELVRACDVFVSLHRSEGFGFGAAEALAHGKAVVATDYGGTADFVTPVTGYPVDRRLVDVRRGEYPGWKSQRWADPSVEHAAETLVAIDRDRDAAAARGLAGRAWMAAHHAPDAVGRSIRSWLASRGWLDARSA